MNLEIKGVLKEYGRRTEGAMAWLGGKAEEWDVRVIHQVGCIGLGAIIVASHPGKTLQLLKTEGVTGLAKWYNKFQGNMYKDFFSPLTPRT